ncbi:MAG TPA: ABC transporter substrate-binding protein [Ktedonobacteraceae bacterium]|nr:ABC transporter substrate-binding protein [Ktedonobacteraceae bacterium]
MLKQFFKRCLSLIALLTLFSFVCAACGSNATSSNSNSNKVTVHLGYFPNMTHAVAIVGVARNAFKQALGPDVALDIKTFNAGPAEIEALFAGDIDIGFVGPNPAVNGYVKSNGAALRIIAGASSGGVLFVVRPGAHIQSARDLNGKKIADPQLGGTQDVSLRHYLQQNGLKPADKGGTVQVIPAQNADILTMFRQGQIDGAWVPEPWASRLVVEDQGRIFLDERSLWPDHQFSTTTVIVSKKFLDQHPDLVGRFLQADVDTVQYIKSNPASARTIINSELKRMTGKELSNAVLNAAFNDLDITYDPLAQTILEASDSAYSLGFLGASKPDLSGLIDLAPLNAVLSAKGLPRVAS